MGRVSLDFLSKSKHQKSAIHSFGEWAQGELSFCQIMSHLVYQLLLLLTARFPKCFIFLSYVIYATSSGFFNRKMYGFIAMATRKIFSYILNNFLRCPQPLHQFQQQIFSKISSKKKIRLKGIAPPPPPFNLITLSLFLTNFQKM